MTKRLSFVMENHHLQSADLVRTACACSSSASKEATMTPKQTALSASSADRTRASDTMHNFSNNTDATVAPTDCTLSP